MGTINIVEMSDAGRRNVGMLSPLMVPIDVTISSTHAETTNAFDNSTDLIRLETDTRCWVKLYKSGAASPLGDVATTSNGLVLDANEPEYFYIPPAGGFKLSIITA